ncbi:deoxyribonuclease HsdR [Aquimarina atlantica]|uniref:Deoxyribonuclease HsdR n=1 Tax=Aquimarina atlantica TaxID=1317122 RepID=A0A023BTR8_9FLAO|nr:HTTM domain-containing protein [Aquimarina atlantica]EZH73183.1 deoxyribonuclease HsdR [Aquimarina atlantica]
MTFKLNEYLKKTTEAAPLAVFRIFFGVMMLISIIRFWSYGWIDKLYIQPKFFFSYYGFEWVKPIGVYTYIIFAICGISTIFITLGFKYRIAIVTFFISFTYIELMDKTTYLNHYYFISLLSFVMIFLPANRYYALDAKQKRISYQLIPNWTIDVIKLLLGIVYFYAGLAKLNSDWLVKAMPLKIWLPSKYSVPLLGDLMQKEWMHYLFSYSGAIYDLTIPLLLLYRKTRPFAFILVVIFHVLTRVLFPIGMFPYIMIVSTLIFFDASLHHKILDFISKVFKINKLQFDTNTALQFYPEKNKVLLTAITIFFAIQLFLPFRYILYPGELFWTEEGFRFSWRVMLIEKAGYANFKIVDSVTKKRFYVDNDDFLTAFQQKQMASQPDFILQYAHYLKQHFENQGHQNIQVFVESYVALNGRLSTQYIDPTVDLGKQKESFKHKNWIIPFKDEIKGL